MVLDIALEPDAALTSADEAARAAIGLPPGARVIVAMSGGVDSTLAAALVKRAGYDVVGVTLQLYDHAAAVKKSGACCAGKDILDARRAAERLRISHYVLDYESRFRESVIDDFADSYLRGETPVPCIRCNQTVKFRDLVEVAHDLGGQAMATGHYVRRTHSGPRPQLRRAADATRDQSYFLFATTVRQLDFLRFPLGELSKPLVRAAAGALGLDVASKPDSQDICFVPEGRYSTLIDKLRPEAMGAGEIVHVDGRILGAHGGVSRFTVGQRRGLNVAVGEPLFVVGLDADRKRVIVGPKDALSVAALQLREVNWLGDKPSLADAARSELGVLARVRSQREPAPASLISGKGRVSLRFAQPEEGVAPGQACVLYAADDPSRVLGGGFIASTERA